MAAQYDFIAGLDISSLSSVTQAQLMQMINQISPISNIGGVIFQAGGSLATEITQGTLGSPDVTNNPRFARYIWLNTYDSLNSAPTPYYYNDYNSKWTSTSVAPGSIINDSINSAAAIDVTKLAPYSSGRYILRTNQSHSAVEWYAPASIFASGELPVVKLEPNGSAAYLKSGASSGPATWVTEATERAAIQAAISDLAVTQLIAGTNGNILYTTGGKPAWAAPSTVFVSGSNIPVNALSGSGAVPTQLLGWNGSAWGATTPSLQINSSLAISTVGIESTNDIGAAVHTITHGFTAIPKMVRVVLKCLLDEGGWTGANGGESPGDEVDVSGSFLNTASGTEIPNIMFGADKTNITILMLQTATKYLRHKSTAGQFTPTNTKWKPKVYAWL
jgi:hypothetical protein